MRSPLPEVLTIMRALETRKRVHRTDKTEPSGSEIEGEREAEGGRAGGKGRRGGPEVGAINDISGSLVSKPDKIRLTRV